MAYLLRLAIGVLLMAATAVSPQSGDKGPLFTNDGSLVLPKGFRSWVFIGGPITPNGLNDGGAPFLNFTASTLKGKTFVTTKRMASFRREPSWLKNSPSRKSASIQTDLLIQPRDGGTSQAR